MEHKTDFRVIEVAKILGVSKVTVYKRMEQCREELRAHTSERGGVTYLDEEGIAILRALLGSGVSRLRPSEKVAVEEFTRLIEYLSAAVAEKKEIIRRKTIQIAEYDALIDKYSVDRRN